MPATPAVEQPAGALQGIPWRAGFRLVAAAVNTGMVLYVYAAHLAGLPWHDFGRSRALEIGQSASLRDYLSAWDLDPAFDHLRIFTFSEAMLENLAVYMVVGVPVAVILFTLERGRVRWLQSLLIESLPQEQSRKAKVCLDLYLVGISITLLFILLIGPFHLGFPRAHYFCAFCAIAFGMATICLYLAAPIDLLTSAAVGAGDDDDVLARTARAQRWVRPVLKAVLALHGLVLAAAIWKTENLGNDHAALLFGVVETSLVVGYQLFQGIFVFDDVVMQRASQLRSKPTGRAARKSSSEQPRPGRFVAS